MYIPEAHAHFCSTVNSYTTCRAPLQNFSAKLYTPQAQVVYSPIKHALSFSVYVYLYIYVRYIYMHAF